MSRSYIRSRVRAELQRNSTQSYESLAAAVDADRTSVIIAVRTLERHGEIIRQSSRGRVPNSYKFIN